MQTLRVPSLMVSIRAPAWGATKPPVRNPTATAFQFALPRGERLISDTQKPDAWRFQFALPRGERPSFAGGEQRLDGFNSRSRVGSDATSTASVCATPSFNSRSRVGSDCCCCARCRSAWRFNSRSRVGSDRSRRRRRRHARVSIRAPAWGATIGKVQAEQFQQVSIRAPAWGATPVPVMAGQIHQVSIRAPAWGATSTKPPSMTSSTFQFALPRGERPGVTSTISGRGSFNSRSRVGSDGTTVVFGSLAPVSIRAPAWGATCHH